MALSGTQISAIETLLGGTVAVSDIVPSLRALLPGVSLTRCDPSDMGVEEPFRTFPDVELYLVDGRDHCWRITGDPEAATGIVVVPIPGKAGAQKAGLS